MYRVPFTDLESVTAPHPVVDAIAIYGAGFRRGRPLLCGGWSIHHLRSCDSLHPEILRTRNLLTSVCDSWLFEELCSAVELL